MKHLKSEYQPINVRNTKEEILDQRSGVSFGRVKYILDLNKNRKIEHKLKFQTDFEKYHK